MLSRTLFRTPAISRTLLSSSKCMMVRAPRLCLTQMNPQQIRKYSAMEDEETFEEFTARYEKEFDEAYDLFEVQRVLNNCFSYDLVPAPAVIEKALRAARRVNDLPTAIRVFEASFEVQGGN